MIRYTCPKCSEALAVDNSRAGGIYVCPQCYTNTKIPMPETSAPESTDMPQAPNTSEALSEIQGRGKKDDLAAKIFGAVVGLAILLWMGIAQSNYRDFVEIDVSKSDSSVHNSWPIIVDRGTLRCYRNWEVTFIADDGVEYTLNGFAKDMHPNWPNIDEIMKEGQWTPSRLIERALRLGQDSGFPNCPLGDW